LLLASVQVTIFHEPPADNCDLGNLHRAAVRARSRTKRCHLEGRGAKVVRLISSDRLKTQTYCESGGFLRRDDADRRKSQRHQSRNDSYYDAHRILLLSNTHTGYVFYRRELPSARQIVVGYPFGCDFAPRAVPNFGFCSLQAATSCGSICGKGLVASFRCGVPCMIGRMQSDTMPTPFVVPRAAKPAFLHATVIWAHARPPLD
jgi:hypothetical protein